MRLKHLKLAGFKSFADPTQIPVPGQLVGVVGPNGCGKSNVIDAVRWVLGEAQAKHLRGETMQDVIFGGTTRRAPLGRASVELVFDNDQGRAPGAWSPYAEIAVKRVLQRDGESAYYINNTRVRRRDVQDIFLGTGLGPRAYAIIEQGMISRIIDARPEELRTFLEEAAGVSKYKDRRRETELRLGDARTNLARTDDIRQELGAQIERLESQSAVARRYHELQQELQGTRNLLLAARARDAGAARERHARDGEAAAAELETETGRMRDAERRLEGLRQDHYSGSDALHGAQGELYEANGEVTRIEQTLQHLRDNRRRLEAEVAALEAESQKLESQRAETAAELERWRAESVRVTQLIADRQEMLAAERAALPELEQQFQASQRALSELQQRLAQAQQGESVAQAQRHNAGRALEQLQARRTRLVQESDALVAPDPELTQRCQEALREAEATLGDVRQRAAVVRAGLPQAESRRAEAARAAEAAALQLGRTEAQLAALEKLQSQVASNEKLRVFLDRHGLGSAQRFWQCVTVAQGWEDALESVLGMRLNAVRLERLDQVADWSEALPPGGVTMFAPGGSAPEPSDARPDLTPLARHVTATEPAHTGVLNDWLHGVYALDDWRAALAVAGQLPPGAVAVSREGHIVTRHTMTFFAPQAEIHGALARSREIESLRRQRSTQEQAVAEARAGAAALEQEVRTLREQSQALQHAESEAQSGHHRLQMESLRLGQLNERHAQRTRQIEQEQGEIAQHLETESGGLAAAERALEQCSQDVAARSHEIAEARTRHGQLTEQVTVRRSALQAAERADQEARFLEQSTRDRIAAAERALADVSRRAAELAPRREAAAQELAGVQEGSLAEALVAGKALREQREQALARLREALEQLAVDMRAVDQERLAAEQKLDPLRERIGDLRLKEQEARLSEEQARAQLVESGADEAALAAELERGGKSSSLQGAVNRLEREIVALGAVNLAALEELGTASERKAYLDAQAADLSEAVATLETAIRKIDRETRNLLQETFDKVNESFSTMFPALFGGGFARLELTGDEILDSGLQVIAQPPGKKTTSIQLLSGGEKALTALSLVFSMFKLNPAPFCLLDEVDAPLDDTNTGRFCSLVKQMSEHTQFLFISHNKITMEMAEQLIGITMQESGVSRMVAVDIEQALRLTEEAVA